MKKYLIINFLFIAIVVVVVLFAIFSFLDHTLKQQTISEEYFPTIDIGKSVTQTMLSIIGATQTAQPTNTPLPPTSTPIPPTATPLVYPDSFYFYGYVSHQQAYNIGCEANVAVDLAAYYDVELTEYEFQNNLPVSDNPDKGFVGDVNSRWGQIPPYAYGVHAAPVADLLNKYGVDVVGGKGYTLDQIKYSLSQSHPVIVWVIGSMEYSKPVEYTDENGVTTIVAPYEHVVVLTGYDEKTVRYVTNGHWANVSNETFLTSWRVLGNMAVMHK